MTERSHDRAAVIAESPICTSVTGELWTQHRQINPKQWATNHYILYTINHSSVGGNVTIIIDKDFVPDTHVEYKVCVYSEAYEVCVGVTMQK